MIANYGYVDGSGEFYISIDTDKCVPCDGKPCIAACPKSMFEKITDDYDDEVVWIKKAVTKSLKYECAGCKPASNRPPLPCVSTCPNDGIKHTW